MMEDLADARWRAALRAKALEEATPEQLERVRRYEPQDEATCALARVVADLESEDARPLLNEAAVVQGALGEWARTHHTRQEDSAPVRPQAAVDRAPKTMGKLGLAAAALLAAALVGVIAMQGAGPTAGEVGLVFADLTIPTSDAPPRIERPPAQTKSTDPPGWTVASGAFVVDDRDVSAGDPLPIGVALVARGELCTEHGGASGCLAKGSRFSVRSPSSEGAQIELEHGELSVTSPIANVFEVRVGGASVHAAKGAEYTAFRSARTWSVEVRQASVTVHRADGTKVLVSEGERWESTEHAKKVAPSSAVQVLARARSLRLEGDKVGAAEAYARLIRDHGSTSIASTARVSLGQLRMELGQPKRALAMFDAYLAKGGSLREDAAYGRIEALRALGKTDSAEAATRAFVERYPTSRYSAKLRKP